MDRFRASSRQPAAAEIFTLLLHTLPRVTASALATLLRVGPRRGVDIVRREVMTMRARRPVRGPPATVEHAVAAEAHRHIELGEPAPCHGVELALDTDLAGYRSRVGSVVRPLAGLAAARNACKLFGWAEGCSDSGVSEPVTDGLPPVGGLNYRVGEGASSPPAVVVGLAPTRLRVATRPRASIDGTDLHPITLIAGGLWRYSNARTSPAIPNRPIIRLHGPQQSPRTMPVS